MTRRILFLLPAVLALALGLAACGGDDDGNGNGNGAATEEPAAGNGEATTLQIAADPDGNLAFDTTSLSAPAGEVTVEFTNDSDVPHDVVIEGVDGAQTEVISGASDSFTVTLEPGEYTFFCSVPGHREAGMEGTLTVE